MEPTRLYRQFSRFHVCIHYGSAFQREDFSSRAITSGVYRCPNFWVEGIFTRQVAAWWLVRSAEPMLAFGASRTVALPTANVSSSTRSGRLPLGSMAESAGTHSVTPTVRGWTRLERQ
jgi:hypothetical protein